MATKMYNSKNSVKQRIFAYLEQNGNYTESDQELIELYAETYEFYQKMRKELKKQPLLMEYTNKAGATNIVKNPLAIEITKTVQVLNNLLKSLGMTPAQRKAITGGGGGGEEDEFDNF